MIRFNKAQIQLWASLTLLMAMSVSCVKADKHAPDVEMRGVPTLRMKRSEPPIDLKGYAQNLITSGDVELARTRDVSVMNKSARYVSRREYTFKMCGLHDLRSQGSILGLKMQVYSELDLLSEIVEIQNDSCVTWQASVPFNYFGDAINLEINFIFKTVRDPKAYIHKKIILNPWDKRRGDNPEFADVTRSGISPQLRKLKSAVGPEEIDMALQGKFFPSKKKLEIGSVNIVPVQKNKQNFVETNLIGGDVEKNIENKVKNENLRMKLQGGQPLQTLDLHLNMRLANLKVRLYNSAQENKDEDLTTGRYRIYAQLVATDQADSGHYILTDKLVISSEKEWTTATMGVNAVLPISLTIRPQWGNLNLLLKVVPVDIGNVEPFEGLYHLGRFNDIAGGKSPLFDLSEYTLDKQAGTVEFSYDQYLKQSKNYADWEQGLTAQNIDNVSTFEKGFRRFLFTQLDVLFSRVMPGDTATDRTIQYTVETCVVDNLTGARPGAGLKFEIETEDRGVKYITKRQTNDLGCLTWVGMISHKFYHRENLIKKYSKLTYIGEDSNRPEYTLDYYINPWDEKFTFGRDARRLPPEYLQQIKDTQKAAPPTRVLITHFNYDATGFRYVIDRYMNMTVKKTVLMTIKPTILKYNSIVWGRSGQSDIRDGIYLMKVAMQKDYLDPMANKGLVVTDDIFPKKRIGSNLQTMTNDEADNIEKRQFLVVKEMLVRVLGGQIVTPIEFEVSDLRTLRIRSQMFIQIETIDEMLLRAGLLADEKLNGLIDDYKSKKIVEIGEFQDNMDNLNKKLNEAKISTDLNKMDEYLQILSKRDDLKTQLQKILGSLDKETLRKTMAQIGEIRKSGESPISIDRNLKFRTLNNALEAMRNRMLKKVESIEQKREREIADSKIEECRQLMSNLVNLGRVKEAELYDPKNANKPGSACITNVPREELFYYLTNNGQAGSDAWFESLFTKDEYDLYKASLLRDDFTKPYPPNLDFNLLSNQGDERIDDQGNLRKDIDEDISGLPRRTFIGPVTFVLNGNGSAMRPTDVLDESGCNGTCEALGEVESEIINKTEPAKAEIRKFGLPQNSAYEKSPYFGSVEHFYKKQVNDLIPMNRGLKYQYHQEMKAFSQVGNFLDQFNLLYVSFGEQKPIKKLDYNCYADWKSQMEESYRKWRSGENLSYKVTPIKPECYVKSDRVLSKDAFGELIDKKEKSKQLRESAANISLSSANISFEAMKEFSKNGLMSQRLDLSTKVNILHKMCYLLRAQLIPNSKEFEKVINERAIGYVKASSSYDSRYEKNLMAKIGDMNYYVQYLRIVDDIQKDCHDSVAIFASDVENLIKKSKNNEKVVNAFIASKARQLPITVERRVRVVNTSNKYLYKDGQTLNYSVGTSFSTSHSMGVSRGHKFDPLETIEKLAGAVEGLVSIVTGGVLGSTSGIINFHWGTSESLSNSDGASVGENTTLSTQISTVDIELAKWEKCTVVRFEDNFILSEINKKYRNNKFIQPSKDIQALGYFLCSGDQDTEDDNNPGQPLRVRERYFYLTQIFNEGDMQDPGALANHPWMLQLRGMRDFGRFEQALKSPKKEVSWKSSLKFMARDLYSALQLGGDSRHGDHSEMEVVDRETVAKALDYMSESFNRVMPTFPGMYTYTDTPYDEVIGWPQK